MNPLDLLSEYLRKVERRLRLRAWARGAALTAAAALALTVVLVLAANSFAFSTASLTVSRTVLVIALALALGFGLIVPLLRLNARRAAREAEEKFPQFQERLLTFAEKRKEREGDPFLELLASDALKAARDAEPEVVAPKKSLFGLGTAAAAAIGTLLWLGMAGPGFWSYGTSLLWAGPPRLESSPFYDLKVDPGNRTVRKRGDQIISAQASGFVPDRVRLFVKYASSGKWEETQMRPQAGSPAFEFLMSGIPESMDYYVDAGKVRSKTFKLTVVDLPGVKRIRVTYKFPAWTGMKPVVEDPGGDLRAVEGTVAELRVETDRPLGSGLIVLDNETEIALKDGVASVPLKKDGVYHIAAMEQGERVRLSDDYFIEVKADNPPTVRVRPGQDVKASPIEEVPMSLEATDDFGVRDLTLHYSVNGGAEKTIPFKANGGLTAEGKTLLALEDFKLVPGDVIGFYATARDARSNARTDIFFVEAQPFEKNFTQSQQGGGGGGGAEEDNKISQRQKEIIAATWNQLKTGNKDKTQAAENAKFLSGVQSKLRDQAASLSRRMKSRELAGANQEFKSFTENMDAAVTAMGEASEKLKALGWQEAMGPEQKALQHLLRAESLFRDIQVAFGNRGGGGGGGGMGRELDSLFDLELDTEKNQYESADRTLGGGSKQKDVDELAQKLKELARRQQELAEQQRKNPQGSQQRWQQEMLRREAEQLQKQMEQMAQQYQMQQLSRQGQRSSSSSSQGGQQSDQQDSQSRQQQQQQMGRGGQQSQQQSQQQQSQQIQQALERLKQATRDMQQASSSQQAGTPQSEAEARRAAERLTEAQKMLSGMRQQQSGAQVSDLARRGERLAEQQQEFFNKVRKEYGDQARTNMMDPAARQKAEQLGAEKEGIQREVQRMEKDLQNAAREVAGTDRGTSSKLRKALSDLQGKEVSRNMGMNAEAIKKGLGGYTVMREAVQSQAMNELRDTLKDAESSLNRGGGKPGDDQKLEQALRQTEGLRRQAEGLGRQGQQGQQQGQRGQQGQPGQGQQQGQRGQQGQQPGQQGQQAGQQGSPGGQRGSQQGSMPRGGERQPGDDAYGGEAGGFRAMNRGGERMPYGGPWAGSGNIEAVERLQRDSMRELQSLRDSVKGDPEVEREIQEMIKELSRLDPKRFPGNPELVERLRGDIQSQLEHLELLLRRKLDDQQGANVRSGASDKVPSGYANSVAEYFRRLSKQ